jgi:hypothetical protein
LLRQLIMVSDRAGQEFIMWYLKAAFDAYQRVQENVQTKLSDVRTAALSPLAMVKNLLTPQSTSEAEVAELRSRLAALEAQLSPKRRRK